MTPAMIMQVAAYTGALALIYVALWWLVRWR
jgi:hypothetical protein